MARPTTQPTFADSLLWIALAGTWSASYAINKVGLFNLEPITLVAGRIFVATAAIVPVAFAFGYRLSRRPLDWFSYAVTGLLGSLIPFFLIVHGQQSVDSALTAILMGLVPVVTAVMAGTVLPDERLTGRIVLGLVGAITGIALLAGPSALLGLGAQISGQVAILGATLCYAASTVYIRRFVTRPPLEMAAGSSLVGSAVIGVAIFATEADLTPLVQSTTSIAAVLFLGLISTAAANLTYFYLAPRLGATRLSQVNFVVPVGGALLGVLLLGEVLNGEQVVALAVIIGSVWLTTTARRSRVVD